MDGGGECIESQAFSRDFLSGQNNINDRMNANDLAFRDA